ncbi:TetR/AcrR family transcriptional regulator [Amnibacterium kyonggiense]|uniref:TetR family transcriptional regulator n=1 Tax=Amnibacterium kyonggiense TaxID=595671 RepID=A0A4R7FQ87_9MICO|nr:TetR/AcrR family transcriptional regulator [Amnibacterium kyonggiense]TDS79935.1 TetR family transcriptional regulator [Amnibacterium kyonggiense]
MVRWEPGARDRLQAAAIALFLERGYEETTVQDIAAAAGLTERTFFRHYADKREVLFGGGEAYRTGFIEGIDQAPTGSSALDLVSAGLVAGSAFFTAERRPWSRNRQRVIDANPALQEREARKRAVLADAMDAALRERGVDEVEARLVAEIGSAVFSTAFRRWLSADEERPLADIELELLDRLRALMPAGAPT